MANKRVARGISKVINKLHGIDNPEPLQEGKGYSTEGAGTEIKKTPQQREIVKKKINEHLIWDLLQEGKYEEALKLVGNDLNLMSPDQKEIMVEWRKIQQEKRRQEIRQETMQQYGVTEADVQRANNIRAQRAQLEQMGKNFATGSGPITSNILSGTSKPNTTKKEAQSLFDALNTSTSSEPKKQTQEINPTKDPERTKFTSGRIERLKVNESEADVLALTFNFMQKKSKWYKQKEKDDKKYWTKLGKQKDKFLDETIQALTGKKVSKMKKMARATRKSGFLKYGLMAAAGIGGLLVAKDSLANINWSQKFNDEFKDFKFPDFEDSVKETGSNTITPSTSATGSNTITPSTSAIGGTKAGNWKKDMEFMNKVNTFASEKEIKASDLLAVMASESGFDPTARSDITGATGLIQFTPKTAKWLGTSTEDLSKMTRSEQFEYVKKFFEKSGGLKKGATAGDIYAQIYLPSRKNDDILSKKGEDYYENNKPFDIGNKGYITKEDLQKRAEKKKKDFFIEDVQTAKIAPKTNIKGIEDLTSFTAYDPAYARKYNTFGAPRETHSHKGIDLGRTEGAPVIARETGKVVHVGGIRGYGYTVTLDHGNGFQTFYAHLKEEPDLENGQIIKRGEAFAKVGRTVGANGEKSAKMPIPHLHLELRKNGVPQSNIEEWNIKQSKLIMEERQNREANLNPPTKPSNQGKTLGVLNMNTNIGGSTTYLTTSENRPSYSPFIESQFNYA